MYAQTRHRGLLRPQDDESGGSQQAESGDEVCVIPADWRRGGVGSGEWGRHQRHPPRVENDNEGGRVDDRRRINDLVRSRKMVWRRVELTTSKGYTLKNEGKQETKSDSLARLGSCSLPARHIPVSAMLLNLGSALRFIALCWMYN